MMSVQRMIPLLLVTVALLIAACGGEGSTSAPSPQGSATLENIVVTRGGQVVGTYATDEAFARASKEAGFQVLPARQLPQGFQTTTINLLDPPAGVQTPLRHVEIGIRSDTGGAMISELNTRSDPGPDAVRINSSNPGDFFASPDSKTFTRLTNDRTYTLGLPNANLAQAEAVEVLASIH